MTEAMFSTCPFVRYQICVNDVLKTNVPISMPNGTSGLQGKGMKRSTLKVRRSNVKVTRRDRRQIWRPGGGIILDPVRSCI